MRISHAVAWLACLGGLGLPVRPARPLEEPAPTKRIPAGIPAYEGYEFDWSDEFDGDGPPDERNWVPETGFVRNQEAQWYRLSNAVRRDGILRIEARRERVPNPDYEKGSADWKKAREFAEYTSACLTTRGKHEFLYGRWEMRARIDAREGLWPAWWALGPAREWPSGGEIDILEYYRGLLLANAAWGTATRWQAAWDATQTPLKELGGDDWGKQFHVWRMDWDEKRIRLLVDDRLLNEVDLSATVNRSADGANPFHERQYMLLNLAVGGSSGGDPSGTEFPGLFEVDWVRVYRPAKKAPSAEK